MIFKAERGSDLNGFLDRGSRLEGELSFDTNFRVDGKLAGSVRSDGDLVVGEGGEVEGQIQVGQLFVSGVVRGTVQVSRRVQIAPGGRVYADVETPSLLIEDGAIFEGNCSMSRQTHLPREAAPGPQLVARTPRKPS